MAKSRNGKFVPPKGRPSGSGKESTGLKDAFAAISPEEDEQIAEKYTSGEEEPAANVHVRHVNRNVNKDEARSNHNK